VAERTPEYMQGAQDALEIGELVEFKQDTGISREWEQGKYDQVPLDFSGWHWVRKDTNETFLVPARRIRKLSEKVPR